MEQKNKIVLYPTRIIFILVFLLLFCFGFILAVITNFQYRAAMVSLLVIPLIFIYGIKLDQVLLAYGFLASIVVFSAIENSTSIQDFILFMRILVFSYLIYYLVKVSITEKSIGPVMQACVWVAVIQLPIMLVQWQLYDVLPLRLRGPAIFEDFGSGTFNYKTDYAMSFFLLMVTIYVLFVKQNNPFAKYKYVIGLWLSLSILVCNAQIVKIPLIIVWGVYVLRNFKIKTLITFGLGALVVGIIVLVLYQSNLLNESITTFIDRITMPGDKNTYLEGGYSRIAGLEYLFTDGFTLLGDGPSAYNDPITRIRTRGNTGHFFLFFSEIGFIGLIASFFLLFTITVPITDGTIRISWIKALAFFSLIILTFTSHIMNDMAVFLIYCIIIKASVFTNNQGKPNTVMVETVPLL